MVKMKVGKSPRIQIFVETCPQETLPLNFMRNMRRTAKKNPEGLLP